MPGQRDQDKYPECDFRVLREDRIDRIDDIREDKMSRNHNEGENAKCRLLNRPKNNSNNNNNNNSNTQIQTTKPTPDIKTYPLDDAKRSMWNGSERLPNITYTHRQKRSSEIDR